MYVYVDVDDDDNNNNNNNYLLRAYRGNRLKAHVCDHVIFIAIFRHFSPHTGFQFETGKTHACTRDKRDTEESNKPNSSATR